jgi:mRNA-degrading endonuclease RelE of RelBE toxin-antitoxin system
MNWELQIPKRVGRQLKRFPRQESTRLASSIQQLASNPYAGDIKKMSGADDLWQRRIGSYRIKYEVNIARKSIVIISVERRTSQTY